MTHRKKRIVWTVTGLLAIVASIAGLYIGQQLFLSKGIDKSLFHGTLLDNPREIHPFALEGIDDKSFDNASLKGRWTLMFFGFTHCGYMCPTTMAELAKMYRLLEEKQANVLPHVVMISLDPKRDSLKRLNRYVKTFDPHFYGARGREEAIQGITRELGVAYARVIQKNTQQDDIEHTGAIMLFNPAGNLIAFFTPPHHAVDLVSDYLLVTHQGNNS